MRKWLIAALALALAVSPGLPAQAASGAGANARQEAGSVSKPLIEHSQTKWKVLPKWTEAPVIDGLLNEPAWGGASELDDFRTAYYNEPSGNGPVYKAAFDQETLYIGGSFDSADKPLLEKIEILVSTASSGEAHHVISLPVSLLAVPTKTDWNVGRELAKENPQRTEVQTFAHGTADAEGRTYIEAAIPLASLGAGAVAPGTEWRMNIVHVYRINTKPLLSWVPIRTSNYWDTGGIVNLKANVVDEGRLGSVFFERPPVGQPWTPQETEWRYAGFTEKVLSVKRMNAIHPVKTTFEVQWKTPTSNWRTLETVVPEMAGDRCTLTIRHPEPLENGLYQLKVIAMRDNGPADGYFTIVTFDRSGMIAAGIEQARLGLPSDGDAIVPPAPASAEVEAVMAVIPDRTGFIFTGLPEMPELHPYQLYTLSSDRRSMVAAKTKTVYPNERYPETKSMTAVNRKGETVDYPYYEDAEGKRYFLSAHLWYLQKDWAVAETEKIAKKDPLGAARLLLAFAEKYEGYVPTTDYIWHNYPISIDSGPPYNYWGGMWYRWSAGELNSLRPLLRAYELVKKTNALQVLSQEKGIDVEKQLVEQMIVPSVDYILSYPGMLSNMNYTQWLGLIDASRAIREPDYIHLAFEWMRAYMETQFLSDGYWKEVAPSYHVQSTNGLGTAAAALNGYSDPAGYVSPRSGVRFDNLQLQSNYPIIQKSLTNNNLLVYPDGKLLPIQDSWAADKSPAPMLDAGSLLMPAAGIGRLADGKGADQTQLYLQFAPKYGHNHYDPLQLNLYARGQELLPDIGYTYTKYREFSLSTMGHNTVVVDSHDMEMSADAKHGGSIQTFAPSGLVQVMRADQSNAYTAVDRYSREPWSIPFPGADNGQGYVVDLFRVSGGSRHEYTLQGDANRDAEFRTDLAAEPYGPYLLPPGTQVREPEQFNDRGDAEGHYYGYIGVKDVRKVSLTDDRYDVTLATSEGGAEKAKLKITGLLEPGSNELFLARSPSLRSTRLLGRNGDTNDEAAKYDMPKLVLRREGTGLKSTFVTAMEPYQGTAGPIIESIERLTPASGPEGAVAVRVTYGDTTDILLSAPGGSEEPLVVEDLTLQGEMGFIRLVNGTVASMQLIGGTRLAKGSHVLTGEGPAAGTITATKRRANGDAYDGVVTDAPFRSETAAAVKGRYVVVTHPDATTNGYRIQEMRDEGGRAAIVFAEHDPGFDLQPDGSSSMAFYPAKSWTGTHTFRVDNVEVLDTNPLQAVSIEASRKELLQGETAALSVSPVLRDGRPAPAAAVQTTYTSSDPAVAEVDASGTITAIGDGSALITVSVSYNGTTKTAEVWMTSQARDYQAAGFIDLPVREQSAPTLYVGGSNTVQFEANEAGGSIAFEFETGKEAVYEVGIKPFLAASYGIYKVLLDGEETETVNFYGTTGASNVFLPVGTKALSPGKHTLTFVNAGKDARSSNFKFGVRELEWKERALDAPPLSFSREAAQASEAVVLSFPDAPDWRAGLVGVSVNGAELVPALYSAQPGSVTFAPGALGESGSKRVVLRSAGYRPAGAEMQLLGSSALAELTIDQGSFVPAFRPSERDYAVSVGPDMAAATITARALQPDAAITFAGQSFTGTAEQTVALHPGANELPILVTASDGGTSAYRLAVYRSERQAGSAGTVTGTVYGPGNRPVAGAKVYVSGYASAAVYTDATGAYRLPDAPAGPRRLAVTAPGYTPYLSDVFTVPAGGMAVVDAVLGDTMPPSLEVTQPYVAAGKPVYVSAPEPLRLLLVPEGTPSDPASLEAAAAGPNGSSANVPAGPREELPTAGMSAGRYALYGLDQGGNLSAAPVRITLIESGLDTLDNDYPLIGYTGQWQAYSGNYIGGESLLSRSTGAVAEIPFYGAEAQWIGARNGMYGIAEVYLDGVFVKKVDLYSPSLQTKQELYGTGPLAPGVHVLRIVASGEKNPASTGTLVSFDALRVTDLGLERPVLSSVTAGPVAAGTPVAATSSTDGMLYLVASGTQPNRTALEQAVTTVGEAVYGVKASALAGVPAELPTAGMVPGRYTVFAVGTDGGVSAGSDPIAVIDPAQNAVDSDSPLVTYLGSWTTVKDARMYGGSERIGTAHGAVVDIPFYGTRAALYGTKASNGGLAEIYVDGVLAANYDYYSGGTGVPHSLLWEIGDLPPGPHTLRIVNTGQKNPLSVNTWIRFDVLRTEGSAS
ncbi:hypothetical protein J31TS4_29940 [Paenibacillus sp. J31TS4]|uniref:carboxypeptidase regulatory-like domain-containing protein n=1 Tax=Paenibacillus sp. J31TS4 TaxID=2807195 RepID=UPI001B21E71D|nr:carboxypeptidase regulatory-like domain-containing protein [Paenibacillus sp. J31TS4]GIP39714.1 hypothetical protein J31TS4_29940 [Paenibacillus sp. J31TS4]